MAKKIPAFGDEDWRKLQALLRQNFRAGHGIRIVQDRGNITIALDDYRKRMPSEGGGGSSVSLYQLTGYWEDEPGVPSTTSFKGRPAPFDENAPLAPEVQIFAWRYPYSSVLPDCNPLLSDWFNSENIDQWVPCINVMVGNPAFDPEAEPDPENPIPEYISAPRILWLFRGTC